MLRKMILSLFLLTPGFEYISGQVRVRLYADQMPQSAILTVTEGEYEINTYDDTPLPLKKNEQVVFAVFRDRIAVKPGNSGGFICDSVSLKGLTGKDSFSLRVTGGDKGSRVYSGDLQCLFDLGFLVFINTCDTEDYIAGVVKAEGGAGRNIEYFKAQAVLVRSYLYRNFSRHSLDNYNLCDDTHCQVFYGITDDQIIVRAARDTKDLVALDSRDSSIIVPAFHSNCGGVTSNSEDVWLANLPYLRKITDPYCIKMRNATWKKEIPVSDWIAYLRQSGYNPEKIDLSVLNYSQITRLTDYRIGSFALPFRQIRNDLNLRSSFFSVFAEGDFIILRGRGYGHGVGLCQEGAMAMAVRGFNFKEIIGFYFTGVIISDTRNAVASKNKLVAEIP